MEAQQFLAEFGHIANAPAGVARLRELVLQLAIQGKLLGPAEIVESSNDLLVEVRSIRVKLVADKKLPREKNLSAISDNDVPVDSPQHWSWARFGEVWHLISGRDLEPSEYNALRNGIPYITGASNIDNGVINITRWTPSPVVISATNDLLITCKGTIGKTVFNKIGDVHIARQIMAIRNFSGKLSTGFLKIWLDGFVSQLIEKSKSMIPGFSRDDLVLAVYPIPPLEEQTKIVAKVNELMALCDTLEAQQQGRRKLQNNLRESTLQAIANATSPHELQTTWARLSDNFGRLFHAPEDVRLLRDVIFDLALRGNLLPNEKCDVPEALLSEETAPLPNGWHWKTLADLSEYITSGSRGWKAYIASAGDSFIRSQDIKHDALVFESPAFVSLPAKAEGKRTLVRQGDLLLTITGGNVGKCATVPDLSQDAYVSQHVALIRLHEPWLADFIHFWMINAFGGRQFLSRYIYGDKPGLNLTQVGSVPIPVPPKSACTAILNDLRRYQNVCIQLERQLKAKQKMASTLALAAVSSLTGVIAEQKEEPMKAPQTELIAPLRLWQTPDIKAQAPLATILTRHNGEMPAKDLWQRFGGEIDAFYAQLKTEVAHGWIAEPAVAEMRETQTAMVNA